MPNLQAHLTMAERNQACLDLLLRQLADHPEWVTTVAFYKAVHLVEAMFANEQPPGHSVDHVDRLTVLRSERRFTNIYRFFKKLYEASLVARYLETNAQEYQSFTDYLTPADVENLVIKHWLHQVRQTISNITNMTLP